MASPRDFGELRALKHIRILPGDYHVSSSNVVMHTLLGSCVSACLYDPVRKVIGMNHFLLSNRRYAQYLPSCITEAGRYGVHAMELLINDLLKAGAGREDLYAKAFGGASLIQKTKNTDNFFCIGEVNTRFIKEFLANEGIPLVSADLGGDRGRVIYFYYDNFSVYVRKIQKATNSKLALKEKQFWRRTIEAQESETTVPDLWI